MTMCTLKRPHALSRWKPCSSPTLHVLQMIISPSPKKERTHWPRSKRIEDANTRHGCWLDYLCRNLSSNWPSLNLLHHPDHQPAGRYLPLTQETHWRFLQVHWIMCGHELMNLRFCLRQGLYLSLDKDHGYVRNITTRQHRAIVPSSLTRLDNWLNTIHQLRVRVLSDPGWRAATRVSFSRKDIGKEAKTHTVATVMQLE